MSALSSRFELPSLRLAAVALGFGLGMAMLTGAVIDGAPPGVLVG